MSDTVWGWLLLVAELGGLAAMSQLVGRRRLWWGWVVVFVCVSTPWLVYSITTARWSFLALSLLWASVHLSNAFRWRRDEHSGTVAVDCENRRHRDDHVVSAGRQRCGDQRDGPHLCGADPVDG